jgi:hypothetical protein
VHACSTNDECAGGFCLVAQGASEGICGAQLALSATGKECDAFR